MTEQSERKAFFSRVMRRLSDNGSFDADTLTVAHLLANVFSFTADELSECLRLVDSLTVQVKSIPDNITKIPAIRMVRELSPSLSIKVAKDFVEGTQPLTFRTDQIRLLESSGFVLKICPF